MSEQLQLSFGAGWGGARRGAGRRRLSKRLRSTPHRTRGPHRGVHPVHVTLRSGLRSLRHQVVARTVLRALRASNRPTFRVVHYSLQDNHVHLIVEASNATQLTSGMRGLAVRVARRVNRLLFRRGRFWTDRWHGHTLTRPREVRNALLYVLQNHRRHARDARPARLSRASLDPLSSARWFDGFVEPLPRSLHAVGPPPLPATTWLLRSGWRKWGRIYVWESPRAR